jgi:hypothetical protein
MSQRCRKFATPQVRQYAGIQITSQKAAHQRTHKGNEIAGAVGAFIAIPEGRGHRIKHHSANPFCARIDGDNPGGAQMDERRFYDEKEETKTQQLVCPHCRQETSFPVRWMVRTKKAQVPAGANEEDKKQFAKARSYMVRVDNLAACRNLKCRKRFELTGQSVFLI